ncbi:ATP-binding protein [Polyangium spumosum]|uniref:histidine kinase n=1 Tax=Polyangium spumosum TaxID=889282 RepID=A0A6N7PUW1_9BACT|nr:PAS domain-containing protein [Polyangium spumosum]
MGGLSTWQTPCSAAVHPSVLVGLLFAILLAVSLCVLLATRLRRCLAARAATERVVSTLMSTLPGAAYRCKNDHDWTVISVSEGIRELTGYPPEAFVETREVTFASLYHPDDLDRTWNEVQTALEARRPFEVDWRLRTRSGEEKWIWERGVGVFGPNGELIAIEGFFMDITARKRAEEAERHAREVAERASEEARKAGALLDALFTRAPVGLAFLDTALRYVRMNEALAAMNGLPVEAHLGRTPSEVVPDVGVELEPVLRRVLTTGEPARDIEASGRTAATPPEQRRHWLASFYAVRARSGELYGVGAVVLDITERKHAESARDAALEEQRAAVRARDDFLAIASHELRTPLTSLKLQLGSLRVALHKAASPDARLVQKQQALERHTERLEALIENLLDVSRITLGRLSLRREEVDLAQIVRVVLERLEPDAARVGSTFHFTCEGPVTGQWDALRVEQVVTNLVSNALKYGRGKPVDVDLSADAHTARLVVRDHGIGIPEEARARIFSKFERAVPSEHYGGLGLGLFIAHQIVMAHDGAIWVESTEGPGATFVVQLPRRAP